MADLTDEKFQKMTTRPVNKLVCEMAAPSIVSMLVTAIYNLADTFFVSKISTQATGALGIVMSYMTLIQAVSFFFGQGSGNYISRELGKKNRAAANIMASTAFFLVLIVGTVIGVLGFVFMKPVLVFLGATDTILPDAAEYFRYILIATPFIMGGFVLNNQMRFQGNAKMGMIGIASGAILNIGLDPLLIFEFQKGITGAAIATAVSQILSFVLLLFLSGKKDGLKIAWSDFKPSGKRFFEIFAGGVPSLARQGMMSVSNICLNRVAGYYGDEAIAAFSVVGRITMITGSALIGFGQGFQPVCGFNFGAGLYYRVKKAFWFCVKAATVAMTLLGVVLYVFAEPVVRIFRDDTQMLKIAVRALRYQCLVMPILGFTVLANMLLQNTRQTVQATVTAMSRQGVMLIPCLFLLNAFRGLTGVQMAQSIADILSCLLAVPLVLAPLRKMKEK